jgi:hypothetical protein
LGALDWFRGGLGSVDRKISADRDVSLFISKYILVMQDMSDYQTDNIIQDDEGGSPVLVFHDDRKVAVEPDW